MSDIPPPFPTPCQGTFLHLHLEDPHESPGTQATYERFSFINALVQTKVWNAEG